MSRLFINSVCKPYVPFRFGTAKLKDKTTLEILVRIVREFDILVVQEVVDASGQALQQLLEEVNKVNDNEGNLFNSTYIRNYLYWLSPIILKEILVNLYFL